MSHYACHYHDHRRGINQKVHTLYSRSWKMALRPFERWEQVANCPTLVWLDMKSEQVKTRVNLILVNFYSLITVFISASQLHFNLYKIRPNVALQSGPILSIHYTACGFAVCKFNNSIYFISVISTVSVITRLYNGHFVFANLLYSDKH